MAKIVTKIVYGKETKVLEALDLSEKIKIKFSHHYVIPQGVNIIGENVFAGNKNLITVFAPDSLQKICKKAFASCVNLKSFIAKRSREAKIVENSAFLNCYNLSRVQFNNIRELGDYAFSGTAITGEGYDVDFSNVQTIGTGTFENCEYLVRINMPFLRVLPDNAFKNCKNLTNFNTGPIIKEVRTAMLNTKYFKPTPDDEIQY